MGEGHSTAKASGALLGLAAGTFVYVTTETLPIGLLLPISADLEITPSAAGLLVTWYGLVVVVASLPLTQLTRRVPRRPLLSGLLGVFVLATWASAAASGYWMLLGARVVTALSQALFWAVVVPTAAGLFPPRLRGRVVAVVLGGGTLAAVLGLPLGTWLGQQAGWRAAFLALSGIGLAAMAATAAWLPAGAPGRGHAARGTDPDRRRYLTLMAMTVLAATGAATAVNVGITAGALVGSVLLPGVGVRGTALLGGLLSLAALAAALVEPVAAGGPRPASAAAPACDC